MEGAGAFSGGGWSLQWRGLGRLTDKSIDYNQVIKERWELSLEPGSFKYRVGTDYSIQM